MQVTPVGVTGEIYLGGAGLARGYLGRPELTAERFVPHPFSAEPGARLYRTGDVARYRPDGELEYLGRIDQQVKVRGFRIELGEIEAALMQHAGVRQAVATADLDGRGEKRLVAYVVAETAEAAAVLAKELREYLLRQLPDYMVPTAFVTLDALPLTPNGKVDRRALPAPDSLMGAPDSTYVAPRTPTEEVLCGIWVEVLGASSGVVRVGIDDDFFELGGHSLLATQVVSRVREALQVEVPLRALFESAQPRQLAARVEALMRGGATLTAPPLVKATGNIDAPLSFAQQRLWFLDQLEPGSAAYNIPAAVRLTGALNVAALERTLDEVVRRHEVLRTVFISAAGQPRQVVREHASQPLEVTDLSHLPQVEREVEARLRASEEAQRPFDLVRGPLLRTSVLRLGEEDHVLLLTMHHIVSDGWSVGVLVREMAALYAAYAEGSESPLEELAIQYGDYARWQREWLTGEVLEEQLGYWREQLAGAPPVLELPADRPRPATPSFRGERESFTIPEVTAEALRALGRREGTTLFMTLLAAFQVLLSRYAGQDDIVVGTPIAGRTRAEVEGLIGFFVNTLVVRVRAERDLSFREVLGRVRESCLGAYAHQDVPFEKLVEELHPERSLSHTPLFQVMFSLQLAGGERLRLAGLELEGMRAEADAAKFDLTLWMTEGEHGLNATLEYNTDLFDAATVERMGGHLQVLLAAAVADSERRIAELPLLTQEEHLRFIEWNDTARDYPADLTVHELFEQQAARQPEAIAVICEDEQLTYRELNEQADRLAHHLRALGAGPESRVALLMERSVAMVAALLGVLKAGGAYVPLDVSYPQERLSFMLEDSGAEVLLTHDRLADALPAGGACVVDVAEVWSAVADYKDASSTATTSEVSAANLAYIIYTSGSTGRPKGVMVEHRQLSNYLWAAIERLRLPAAASYAVVSTLAADLGHTMTFPALCLGGQLHVLTRERASDAEALGEYFRRHAIDCLKIVPSHLEAVCGERGEGLPRLRLVLGGEAARAGLVERLTQLAAPECEIYNHYGPTETTVGAVAQRIGHGGGNGSGGERAVLAGLGQPLGNVRAYVLDGEMRACAVGEAGELYVGGAGVARGYLDRPELTAERFVPDVMGVGGEGGGRLYRTGDVGRVQADGTIEFLGRIDNQIKIRGFRIEVGEIENALASHPSVSEAVVTAREDVPGQKRLIAYVVGARHPRLAATSELRRHLQERLPDYMVPTAFVTLDALPLTPNGKVDRRALPPPDATRAALSAGYVEPQSAAQQVMAEIWADVLGVERVGLEDNFFELGGHSLLATQVISRVREALQCELPLRKLFETPTVAGLVEHVGEQLGGAEVVEEVARTFNELKNLSDEEVRMLLAR
jgi:amino acid adenylation domain-containing protein